MKDKNVAAILALFLGGLGVHKFYLGRIGAGILYLVFSMTFIPAFLGLIDFFVLALMENEDFNRRFNGTNQISPVVVNMLPPAYPPAQPGYGYPPAAPPQHPHPQAPPPPGYGPAPGAYGPPPAASPSIPPAGSLTTDQLATKLEKLNELRISGLLSEEEFQQQKSRLLAQT